MDAGGGVHTIADDEPLLCGLGRGDAPRHDPDAGLEVGSVLGAVGRYGRDELKAGPHGTLGVVLLCDRYTPDRHDCVADELLDDAAVASDDRPGELEVTGEELSHLLGVSFLRERREADEVTEQHGHMPELGGGTVAGREADAGARTATTAGAGVPVALVRVVPHSLQNFARDGSDVPQLGQARASAPPHSRQNLLPDGFSAPHAEQDIYRLLCQPKGYDPGDDAAPGHIGRATSALCPGAGIALGRVATPFGSRPHERLRSRPNDGRKTVASAGTIEPSISAIASSSDDGGPQMLLQHDDNNVPSSDEAGRSPATSRPCLRVEPWLDPVIDNLGHDPRSAYVETFWLPVLGPSTTWLLRHLTTRLEESPEGVELDVDETSAFARARGASRPERPLRPHPQALRGLRHGRVARSPAPRRPAAAPPARSPAPAATPRVAPGQTRRRRGRDPAGGGRDPAGGGQDAAGGGRDPAGGGRTRPWRTDRPAPAARASGARPANWH